MNDLRSAEEMVLSAYEVRQGSRVHIKGKSSTWTGTVSFIHKQSASVMMDVSGLPVIFPLGVLELWEGLSEEEVSGMWDEARIRHLAKAKAARKKALADVQGVDPDAHEFVSVAGRLWKGFLVVVALGLIAAVGAYAAIQAGR